MEEAEKKKLAESLRKADKEKRNEEEERMIREIVEQKRKEVLRKEELKERQQTEVRTHNWSRCIISHYFVVTEATQHTRE